MRTLCDSDQWASIGLIGAYNEVQVYQCLVATHRGKKNF